MQGVFTCKVSLLKVPMGSLMKSEGGFWVYFPALSLPLDAPRAPIQRSTNSLNVNPSFVVRTILLLTGPLSLQHYAFASLWGLADSIVGMLSHFAQWSPGWPDRLNISCHGTLHIRCPAPRKGSQTKSQNPTSNPQTNEWCYSGRAGAWFAQIENDGNHSCKRNATHFGASSPLSHSLYTAVEAPPTPKCLLRDRPSGKRCSH